MNKLKHFENYTVLPEKGPYPIIKAQEFLSWAKADLKGSDNRARGNAIGNIKKAIHSKIDEIIHKTHVRFGKDWNPRCNTEIKLKILKKLGIKYNSIVKPITDIRDIYEHKYRVPDLEKVRFYYDVAELWLKETSERYDFGQIAIANLPFKSGGITFTKGKEQINNFQFTEKRDVIIFDNPKGSIYVIKKDGTKDQISYKDLTWQELLDREKEAIKNIYGNYSQLSQETINMIILEYIRWLDSQ